MIQVALTKCDSYDLRILKQCFERTADKLGLQDSFHGQNVLLKPNLITGRGPALACTNIHFVQAAAEWFLDNGAEVSIGDSPAFGSALQVMKSHGMLAVLKHLNLKILEFKTPVDCSLSHGVDIGIAAEALNCDLLVNLPKIKAHNQMYLTMGVKNLFGIVCGMRKAVAHMKNGNSHLKFADLMLDLTEIIPRSVTFADGIEVMHREGPIGGELLELRCFGASTDPVALDTAMIDILELDKACCPIWKAAEKRDLPGSSIDNIDFQLEVPSAFHGTGFVAPETLAPVPFNPLRFISSSIKKIVLRLRN